MEFCIFFMLIFSLPLSGFSESPNLHDENLKELNLETGPISSRPKFQVMKRRRGPVLQDNAKRHDEDEEPGLQDHFLGSLKHDRVQNAHPNEDENPHSDTVQNNFPEESGSDEDIKSYVPCGDYTIKLEMKKNMIIKSKKSIIDGAKFLLAPTGVHSNKECIHHCCGLPECSLAVFDGKGMSSCYLFDCKPPKVCHFTEHVNYTSSVIKRILEKPKSKAEEHESELENLKTDYIVDDLMKVPVVTKTKTKPTPPPKPVVKDIDRTTTTTTTTTIATTTTSLAPTTPVPTRYVSLLSVCSVDLDCKDKNAVCDRVCMCKAGMKPSYGKCAVVEDKEQCSHLEFTCRTNNLSRFPHCIATYDRCDGISQCPDGSDEVGCQNDVDLSGDVMNGDDVRGGRGRGEKPRPSTVASPLENKEIPSHTDSNDAVVEHHVSPKKGSFMEHEMLQKVTKDEDKSSNKDHSAHKPDSDHIREGSITNPHQAGDNKHHSPSETETDTPDYYDEHHVPVDLSPAVDDDVVKAVIPDVYITTPPPATDAQSNDGLVKKPLLAIDGKPSHILISQIEIERQNSAQSTFLEYDGDLQGAIIALALGLSITAVLLIFVVCKLRNVKRRLRRGRLASPDADYLINGMYL